VVCFVEGRGGGGGGWVVGWVVLVFTQLTTVGLGRGEVQ